MVIDGILLDGGMPADSGVDAGRADAGPEEPLLASSLLYRDDFESYADLAELKSNYPLFREQGGSIALEAKSMRVDYASDGGCADAEVFVGKLVAGDLPEVIASWRFKVEAGFVYVQSACGPSSGSTEFAITRPGEPSGRVTVEVSAEAENPVRSAPAGVSWRVGVNDAFAMAPRRAVYAQHLRVETQGPLALSRGEWHRVTLAVRRETSVARGDGLVQLWVDGVIVIDVGNAASGTAPFSSVRYPTSLRGGARAQSRWFDDVVLFAR